MIYKARNRISAIESEDTIKELTNILNRKENITIDMKRTEYISSIGFKILFSFMKNFQENNCEFNIINANDIIKASLIKNGINSFLINNQETDGVIYE